MQKKVWAHLKSYKKFTETMNLLESVPAFLAMCTPRKFMNKMVAKLLKHTALPEVLTISLTCSVP